MIFNYIERRKKPIAFSIVLYSEIIDLVFLNEKIELIIDSNELLFDKVFD